MAESWRLIFEDSDNPIHHLATLEALWRTLDEGLAPDTLVLRRLSPSVLIGSSQLATQEVNLLECQRRGIPVLRRPSEGGAIYCDPDCLVFSVVCRRCARLDGACKPPLERWSGVLVQALNHLGIAKEACFVQPNDITVAGKKVAGLTLTDWYGVRSFSGALLIDVNLEAMAAVLTPSTDKLNRHGVAGLDERVTSLRRILNQPLPWKAVTDAVIRSIEKVGESSVSPAHLSSRELDLAEELKKRKYENPTWNVPDESLGAQ